MNKPLASAIVDFFKAHNTGQTDDFLNLFTADALVHDEAHEYRGPAIRQWIDEAVAKYQPIADITNITTQGDQTLVTAKVSGKFPGSPVQLCYRFTLRDDKIAELAIGP
ncbi:MAG: nuclear transport factor 2 family protein [Phycisphaerales bacterium]|nr:nuclear transport factor 2 family protein [Phycisphaerales bacterium]